MPDGREFHTKKDGDGVMKLPEIRNIGIAHIVEIRKHSIVEHEGLFLHTIEFRNGGLLAFTYDENGKIRDLTASKLIARSTPEFDVIYSMDGK